MQRLKLLSDGFGGNLPKTLFGAKGQNGILRARYMLQKDAPLKVKHEGYEFSVIIINDRKLLRNHSFADFNIYQSLTRL